MDPSDSVSRLFGKYLREKDTVAGDFPDFCAKYPDQRSELQRLMEDWEALDEALRLSTVGPPRGLRDLIPGALADLELNTADLTEEQCAQLQAFASHWDLREILQPGEAEADQVGARVINREFRLIRRIGRGGMGDVWMAEQIGLKRTVAVKVLKFRHDASAESQARLMGEARLAARLQHPNIVPVYTAGMDDGQLYYVMEHVEGATLDRVIESLVAFFDSKDTSLLNDVPDAILERLGLLRAALPAEGSTQSGSAIREARVSVQDLQRKAARFFVESLCSVAAAIDYSHRNGIVHGDIKPSNLMFDRQGRLRVLDFGLARLLEDATESTKVMGTPRYMSPELVAGLPQGLSPSIDIYALGATLFECVTWRPMFEGSSRAQVLQKISTESPPNPRDVNGRVHPDLESIILKAISRQPRMRYPSAADLASDLRRFIHHQPLATPGSGRFSSLLYWRNVLRGRFGAVAAGAAAAALSAVLFGCTWVGSSWWRSVQQSRFVQQKTSAVRTALDDVDALIREYAPQPSSGSRFLSRIETELEGTRKRLLTLRTRMEPDEFEVEYWSFQERSNSARILANAITGRMQVAWQLLESGRRQGVLEEGITDRLTALGLLSELVVDTDEPANVEVLVRAVNRRTKEVEDEVLHRGPAPLIAGPLLAGSYHITLADEGARTIQFPFRVPSNQRTTVVVPYLPSEVDERMVYVAGHEEDSFVFGDRATSYGSGSSETVGERLIDLPEAFFIDRFEVTNREFYEFFNDEAYLDLVRDVLQEDGSELALDDAVLLRAWPADWAMGQPRSEIEDKPVYWHLRFDRARSLRYTLEDEELTWQVGYELMRAQIKAFARWRGKQLPTELQWEKAARGFDGRIYCYGDEFDPSRHYSDVLLDVGSMPDDRSVYGVQDLMGSVPELVRSPLGQSTESRGGAYWFESPDSLRLARRGGGIIVGFRCALTGRAELEVKSEPL